MNILNGKQHWESDQPELATKTIWSITNQVGPFDLHFVSSRRYILQIQCRSLMEIGKAANALSPDEY